MKTLAWNPAAGGESDAEVMNHSPVFLTTKWSCLFYYQVTATALRKGMVLLGLTGQFLSQDALLNASLLKKTHHQLTDEKTDAHRY